ncbi:hypothetical protein [Streptomyces adelaidensis]|uniref:hypothetical protein n=1 Tax=Streptomyces adelaidensis TaxID=2796465 RepID=UPI001905F2C6|nr:hypothetical protein [Streptomyces adelaidensis]
MTDHYPYRIAGGSGYLVLIWRPGKGDAPDEFVVDDHGRLLASPDTKGLQKHCERNGRPFVQDEEATLDLEAVREWAEGPRRGPVPAGLLLDAWNFFDDLSHSRPAGSSLPAQGPIHDDAYEKIFGGDEACTDEEMAAMGELLRAGLNLWERSARGSVIVIE